MDWILTVIATNSIPEKSVNFQQIYNSEGYKVFDFKPQMKLWVPIWDMKEDLLSIAKSEFKEDLQQIIKMGHRPIIIFSK